MTEEIRKLEQAMNDYIVRSNAENTQVYNNLELFYGLSSILVKNLLKHTQELNVDIDYSKITKVSIFDKLKLLDNFYKSHSIEFDLDKHTNDGTIGFKYYDHLNDNNDSKDLKNYHFNVGTNYYDNSKKLVDSCNNGFITDTLVLCHELSHYRNQPDKRRNQVNDLLTEALAYAEELICGDYLKELGYQDDIELFRKRLYYNFYKVARESQAKYKMFFLYKNLGSVSENSYELLYGNKEGYESHIKYMNQFTQKNNFDLYFYSWYVMGSILGTHLYYEYKNNPLFLKNIKSLHDRINDSGMLECFELMGLTDLGLEDIEKLENSLNSVVSEVISKERCKVR